MWSLRNTPLLPVTKVCSADFTHPTVDVRCDTRAHCFPDESDFPFESDRTFPYLKDQTMSDNRVDAVLTAADAQAVLAAIQTIRTKLPY